MHLRRMSPNAETRHESYEVPVEALASMTHHLPLRLELQILPAQLQGRLDAAQLAHGAFGQSIDAAAAGAAPAPLPALLLWGRLLFVLHQGSLTKL